MATKPLQGDLSPETRTTEPSTVPTIVERGANGTVGLGTENAVENVTLPSADSVSAWDVETLMKARGHALFSHEGKLIITQASTLTDEERELLRHHKPMLLAIVPLKPGTEKQSTLVRFLSHQRPEPPKNWKPDEPPILDGIDNLIVNAETTGFDWQHKDRPISITVGTFDGQLQRFLPFGFRSGNLDEATIKRWAKEQLKGKHILNAKTKFDIHHLREWGVDLVDQGCTFSDVQHYAALTDDHRKRFGIDHLANDLLGGIKVPRVDESRMATYEASEVAERAIYQVELVRQLRDYFWPILDSENLQAVRQLEDDVILPVVEMEKNACYLDRELLFSMDKELENEYHTLIREISREIGFSFDNSRAGWVRLFGKYKLDVVFTHNKGKATPSFKEEVLKRFDHPVIRKAMYAQKLATLRSKSFTPFIEGITNDDLFYFGLNQLATDEETSGGYGRGTVSGRFSAGYIQQQPAWKKHFAAFGDHYYPRKVFRAKHGQYFVADAAQIEYRIFAHHANNPKILKAYEEDPTRNFHKLIMSYLQPYKPDLIYEGLKAMNFMIIYGGGLVKLALMMGYINESQAAALNAELDYKKRNENELLLPARQIQSIYNRELPEVNPLTKRAMHLALPAEFCDESCRKRDKLGLHKKYPHRGFVKTWPYGRRSRFPDGYRTHKALNAIIQGTAADIMKKKLVETYHERKNLGFTMRTTVHDELGGDIPDAEQAKRLTAILNQQSFPFKVPILWEEGLGANWAEAKGM